MMMTVVGEDRVSAYLDAVSDALRRVDPKARAEIIGELSNHIAESQAAGRSPHDVIDGLGDPSDLAAMYERELWTAPKAGWRYIPVDSYFVRIGRWLAHSKRLREMQIVALLAVPLLVIVGTVVTSGVSLIAFFANMAERSHSNTIGLFAIVVGFVTLIVGSVLIARVWRSMTRLIRRASEGKAIQLTVIRAWPQTPRD